MNRCFFIRINDGSFNQKEKFSIKKSRKSCGIARARGVPNRRAKSVEHEGKQENKKRGRA
jgi:hypothetical protein